MRTLNSTLVAFAAVLLTAASPTWAQCTQSTPLSTGTDRVGAESEWALFGNGAKVVAAGKFIHLVYSDIDGAPNTLEVFYVRSEDGGQTWTTPTRLSVPGSSWIIGFTLTPTIALDQNGFLGVAMNEARTVSWDPIMVARGVYYNYSTDGGDTWLATPVLLHEDAFAPAIAANGTSVEVAFTTNSGIDLAAFPTNAPPSAPAGVAVTAASGPLHHSPAIALSPASSPSSTRRQIAYFDYTSNNTVDVVVLAKHGLGPWQEVHREKFTSGTASAWGLSLSLASIGDDFYLSYSVEADPNSAWKLGYRNAGGPYQIWPMLPLSVAANVAASCERGVFRVGFSVYMAGPFPVSAPSFVKSATMTRRWQGGVPNSIDGDSISVIGGLPQVFFANSVRGGCETYAVWAGPETTSGRPLELNTRRKNFANPPFGTCPVGPVDPPIGHPF